MLARDTGIYKDTQALLKQVADIAQRFPKLLKHTIGERAIDSCVEMLTCVQMANLKSDAERLEWMDEFIVYEERLRTLMEVGISNNRQDIGDSRIAEYTRLLTSVGRQMTGWRKSTEDRIRSISNNKQ